MAYSIGMALSFGILWLLHRTQIRLPNLTMLEVFDHALGKLFSRVVLCFYLVYLLEIQGDASQALTSFYRSVVLPNTPTNSILLMLALTTTYAVSVGFHAIVRSVLLALPFFLLGIAFILLMISQDVHTNPFLPPFRHSAALIGYGGLLSFFLPFGKSIVFCFLFDRIGSGRKKMASIFAALFLAGLYLCAATYLTFGSLGMRLTSHSLFPFFSAIQLVKLGEYLERIEIMIIGIWTLFTVFEIIVLQYIFVQLFTHVFRIQRPKWFVLPIGLLFFAISERSFREVYDQDYYNSHIAPFSTLIPTVVIPLLLFVVGSIRLKRLSGA